MATPEWLATYNSEMRGLCKGFFQWAGQQRGPITDVAADAMLQRCEAAAARAADRIHGVQPLTLTAAAKGINAAHRAWPHEGGQESP